jgi:hypothetical protein
MTFGGNRNIGSKSRASGAPAVGGGVGGRGPLYATYPPGPPMPGTQWQLSPFLSPLSDPPRLIAGARAAFFVSPAANNEARRIAANIAKDLVGGHRS